MLPIVAQSSASLISPSSQRRPGVSAALPLPSGVASTDPETAKRLEEKKRQGQDAAAAMEQAAKQMRADRKSAALEKMARIKEELRIMRMMGADAKSLARVARDLGAAAKEYASGMSTKVNGEPENAAAPLAVSSEGDSAAVTPAAQDRAEQVKAAALAQFAANEQLASERKGDQDFAIEAKRLLQEIKTLLEREKTKARNGKEADQAEAREAQRAVSVADQEISSMIKAIPSLINVLS